MAPESRTNYIRLAEVALSAAGFHLEGTTYVHGTHRVIIREDSGDFDLILDGRRAIGLRAQEVHRKVASYLDDHDLD